MTTSTHDQVKFRAPLWKFRKLDANALSNRTSKNCRALWSNCDCFCPDFENLNFESFSKLNYNFLTHKVLKLVTRCRRQPLRPRGLTGPTPLPVQPQPLRTPTDKDNQTFRGSNRENRPSEAGLWIKSLKSCQSIRRVKQMPNANAMVSRGYLTTQLIWDITNAYNMSRT